MLFDLRGRGRRRTIQVIYLTLAILMGGGLVLFGIGGATSGGLVDAISGGGGGSDNVFEDRVDNAQKKVDANPRDAAALAALAQARYQFALDQGSEADAREQLALSDRAWQRYLALKPTSVDGSAARVMMQVYGSYLNKPEEAVSAAEYAIDADPEAQGLYGQLFQFALQAGQERKAQLAYDKALELAPSEESRKQLKTQLDQLRAQIQSEAGTSTTTTPGATGG